MSIDKDGGPAPYRQLYMILKERIESGEIPAGKRLPSEFRIEEEFGVSRNTIRKAVDLLRADGLVATVPGIGIQVVGDDTGSE